MCKQGQILPHGIVAVQKLNLFSHRQRCACAWGVTSALIPTVVAGFDAVRGILGLGLYCSRLSLIAVFSVLSHFRSMATIGVACLFLASVSLFVSFCLVSVNVNTAPEAGVDGALLSRRRRSHRVGG